MAKKDTATIEPEINEKPETTEKPEIAPPDMVTMENVGACLIKFDGKKVLPGETFEIEESQVDRFRHDIFKGRVEFHDDIRRTRDYISAVKAKAKTIVQPTSAE